MKIQLKRGNKGNLPSLDEAEMAFVLDEKELYIGDGQENRQIPLLEDGKIPNDMAPENVIVSDDGAKKYKLGVDENGFYLMEEV